MAPVASRRAAAGSLLLLAACGRAPAPLLSELPSFHGRIAVGAGSGDRFEAELTFDRSNRNLQLTVRGPDHTTATARRPGGGIAFFRDGVPSPAPPAAVERFALVERLVEGPAVAPTARSADGYTLTAAEGAITVRILEVFSGGTHGWR